MTDQKEHLLLEFAKYISSGMRYQLGNFTNWPPEQFAKLAFDYADAMADEFIKRQSL